MAKINAHFEKLQSGYLFPEIGRRVSAFQKDNPQAKIIRLGIGDVVLPLPESARLAIHSAVAEMGTLEGFKGYGPEQGYPFLREAIASDYVENGAKVLPNEVFVSDGSKCDSGNIQEIFSSTSIIAISDPVYPVYVDANVMAGRTGIYQEGKYQGLTYMALTRENDFEPEIPQHHTDLVYLCSPNNPTGSVLSRASLEKWVAYAKREKAVLLYDGAYEKFISDESQIHSIYEIPGARDVAIEFRSFSKHGGFTGIRCAYTIVPENLMATNEKGEQKSLHALWVRRQGTKFNGVSYPIQKGAGALFSEKGKKECDELIQYYMENARIIGKAMKECGAEVYGGVHAPYLWVRTPDLPSWDLFDLMLKEAQVVITPGLGFGSMGEGYFRISAFALKKNVDKAILRIQDIWSKIADKAVV